MKNEEEYELKIGELELQIEEMERSNSMIYGVVFGLLAYFNWHNWVFSFVIAIGVASTYWFFLAKKPFTRGITSDRPNETKD